MWYELDLAEKNTLRMKSTIWNFVNLRLKLFWSYPSVLKFDFSDLIVNTYGFSRLEHIDGFCLI